MKRTITFMLILVISGCGAMKGLEAQSNRKKLKYLEVGMTKEQVVEAMGEPYNREKYPEVELWYYITEWQPDYKTTTDEMTPLLFKDGKLQGWGRAYVDADLKKYEIRLR